MYDDTLADVQQAMDTDRPKKETDDPVGQAIRATFASIDDLIALASRPETRAQVCAEKVALGQMLSRCQLLASFALSQEVSNFRVIHGNKA